MPWSRAARTPLGLLAGCCAAWWCRAWLGSAAPRYDVHNFDALMYWGPLVREAAAQWARGAPPLWNPYQALGTPLLATLQVGAVYPLNVVYLLLPVGWAWFLSAVLHHANGGVGLYACCRALALSLPASIVGATVYMFALSFLNKYMDQPAFICIAWVPVLCALATGLVAAPTGRRTGYLAIAWALQLLGGHPETIAYTAVFLGAYLGTRMLASALTAPEHALRCGMAGVLAATLALSLAALQLLPTWQLLQHSVRTPGSLTMEQLTIASADLNRFFVSPPAAVPRAFFIAADQAHDVENECVARLLDPHIDLGRVVLLDRPPHPPLDPLPPHHAAVTFRSYAPSAVELEATTDQPGFVVLTDAYSAGWTAEVSGVVTPIVRADCFFRAIAVTPGTHVIRMHYAPTSFRLGLAISVVGLGTVGLLLRPRRRGTVSSTR